MRIKAAREYQEVFEHRLKQVGKGLVVYFKPDDLYKVGVVVSKKIDKRAVIRNKIKRRLREVVRLNQADKQGKYILIARDHIKDMDVIEIQKEFNKAVKLLNTKC